MIRRRSRSTHAQSSSSVDVQSLVLSNELEKGKESAILVSREPLETINALPRFSDYVSQLWKLRHFIYFDARSKAFKSSRDLLLGRAWIIIQPLIDVMIYAFIFGVILKTSRGIDNFLGYLTIGVIFFGFITTGLNSGTKLIQNSYGLISSFSFPKAALPIALVTKQFIDNLPPAIISIALSFVFQWPQGPTWRIFFIIPLYILAHLLILGVIFIVARLTAFIPDLKALVGILSRALFFTSGVFFSIERFSGSPTAQKIMENNPGYIFLQACRDVTIYNKLPDLSSWIHLIAWSFVLLIIGFIFFWKAEERYASVK